MTILGSFTILLFTAWLPAPGWCLGTESSLLEVKVADLSSGKMIHSLTLRSMKYWNIYKYYTRDSHLINVDWSIHAQCDEWPYPDGVYYLDIWVLLLVTHRDQDVGLDDEPAGTVELGCQPHVGCGAVFCNGALLLHYRRYTRPNLLTDCPPQSCY